MNHIALRENIVSTMSYRDTVVSRAVADAVKDGCSRFERTVSERQKQLVSMRVDGRVPFHCTWLVLFKVFHGQPTSATASVRESRSRGAK